MNFIKILPKTNLLIKTLKNTSKFIETLEKGLHPFKEIQLTHCLLIRINWEN